MGGSWGMPSGRSHAGRRQGAAAQVQPFAQPWVPIVPETPTDNTLAAFNAPPPDTSGQFKGKKRTLQDWEDMIMEIVTKMNKGLDFNDPRTQSILNNARQSTMQSANDRGIFGGYSENMAEGSYIDTAAKLQQQKDAMGLQALMGGANFARGLAQDQYEADMNSYNMDQEGGGDLGSMIGGGLGALGGALPGIFTLNPALAFSGGAAGYQLGSGIGGQIGKGASGAKPPRYGGY